MLEASWELPLFRGHSEGSPAPLKRGSRKISKQQTQAVGVFQGHRRVEKTLTVEDRLFKRKPRRGFIIVVLGNA
ncbi:MAG: hypothetical protein D6715_11240 [Calditrichaeota bacterium]|nr:MAG: hypothetical protein D6715_11240 [Calditrichota bacterium]